LSFVFPVAASNWLETTEEVTACVTISGFPKCEVRLITEKGTAHNTSQTKFNVNVKACFVRVEVRNLQDGMLGLANPIWIL
jgi:hypothetical protein